MFTRVAARMTRWLPIEAFSSSASAHSLPPEPLLVLCFRPERELAGSDFHRRIDRALQGTYKNRAERAIRPLNLMTVFPVKGSIVEE